MHSITLSIIIFYQNLNKFSIIASTMNAQKTESQTTQSFSEQSSKEAEMLFSEIYSIKNETDAEELHPKFLNCLKNADGFQFESALRILAVFFQKGYSGLFAKNDELMRKMMNHFTQLSKMLEKEQNSNIENRMLYILSVIAELIKQQPKLQFPFTRKFMINVFSIDYQLLEGCSEKDKILAILSVIFNNLSKQTRLIKKLKVQDQIKKALLENYSLVDEVFTLKLFNQTIYELHTKGVTFCTAEFHRYGIMQKLASFMAQSQMELFKVKMQAVFMKQTKKEKVFIIQGTQQKSLAQIIDEE